MKKVLGLAFMLFLVTGCFGGKEATTVCKSEELGEYVIESEGDEITVTVITETIDFNGYGVGDTDEEIEEYVQTTLDAADPNLEGVSYEIESVKDGVAKVVTTYDYAAADLDALAEANIIDPGADYISLEKTIEFYEDEGLSCTEE